MATGATASVAAPRIALVHDFLLDLRGAERVFAALCDMWPDADIFTAVYDERGTEGRFSGRAVHTSFLQRLRPSTRTFRALLPLYPAAIESFDLSGYDLVVSSSSAWAHAVLCDERTVHVSYCHNPFRYAWNDRDRTLARLRDPVTRAFLRATFRRWRQWDWIAAQRTDRYVANSRITQARIRAYFGREAAVVHPPVDTERFGPGPVGGHYVVVSELMAHKQIDVAIAAFNKLGLPLVVIGDGPDFRRLKRQAGPTIQFAGRLSDGDVADRARERAGAGPDLDRGVRDRGGRESGRGQAGDRQARRRRAGDGGRGGHRDASGPVDRMSSRPRCSSSTTRAVDPQQCVRNARRFDAGDVQAGDDARDPGGADRRLPAGDSRAPAACVDAAGQARREGSAPLT